MLFSSPMLTLYVLIAVPIVLLPIRVFGAKVRIHSKNSHDFCKVFIPLWQKQLLDDGTQKRRRNGRLTTSEIMTIVVGFHMSHYRDFKNYYLGHVSLFHKKEFPNLLNYTRFLAVMPRVIVPISHR
tara:strand:+ start:53278 stop:53655 length:378 start_codon:yes stop_codon:yes gene_type:complete